MVAEWTISVGEVKQLKGIRLKQMREGAQVVVEAVELIADGRTCRLAAHPLLEKQVT